MTGRTGLLRRAQRAARRLLEPAEPVATSSPATSDRLVAGPYDVPAAPARPRRNDIRAAVAVSDRLSAGLAWEWQQQDIAPATWQETLAGAPDLVLLELVGDSVPGWGRSDGSALTDLAGGCRASDIPITLWVTASCQALDSVAVLVENAAVVFVADGADLERWRARWPDAPVELLPPAAQPRLSAPFHGGPGARRQLAACLMIEPNGPAADTAAIMGGLIGPAVKPLPRADLDIWRIEPPGGAQLPTKNLDNRDRGALPYTQAMVQLGRYQTLVDASRGGGWAVVEAGAAATTVVTTTAQRTRLPAEIAAQVGAADEQRALRSEIVARISQPELRDREATRLHRAVLSGHTYAHRVEHLLGRLGRPAVAAQRSVSAVVPTNRAHQLDNVFENIGRQQHRDLELVLVLHGLQLNGADLRARAKEFGVADLTIVEADSSLTLGACMNLGIDAASGAYIAKMDDDNFYGAHYLTDLVHAFDYTDAGIVGKWAHYVWLRSTDAVVLRYVTAEHTYERRVQGGSMVIEGDLARRLRFADLPRAVDSDLLDRAIADGVKIYSADRFNFVSVRGTDRQAHTWQVADSTFMTGTGRLVFYGDPRIHADV
jgi:Glycosyl transferase family 2